MQELFITEEEIDALIRVGTEQTFLLPAQVECHIVEAEGMVHGLHH